MKDEGRADRSRFEIASLFGGVERVCLGVNPRCLSLESGSFFGGKAIEKLFSYGFNKNKKKLANTF